jgi:HAMP domain-containing protein
MYLRKQAGRIVVMLVICEECAKKYHVDINKIKGTRAKFSCKACGHVIVVEKPEPVIPSPVVAAGTSASAPPPEETKAGTKTQQQPVGSAVAKGRGKPFIFYLLTVVFLGFLIIGGSFVFLYFKYVPHLLWHQMELRSLAVATSLQQAVSLPLLRKDYLVVSQITQQTATLPGIAYTAVVNEKGVVVAGFFNTMKNFESHFRQQVEEKGFPMEVLALNGLKAGAKEGSVRIEMGGQSVQDRVLALTETDGEVHVGLFTNEAETSLRQTLLSPLFFVPALLALCFALVLTALVNWLIARPARSLTGTANRISLGELDLAIAAEGSREIRDLGMALERMRHSVRIAVEKLTTSS